ncbi:MAG: NAD(P)/FAD-dependent oxidoreductase [Terriglobales bacterium]
MANFSSQEYDAIILGAGAAGLMCAIEAGKRGRRVLVLERSERIGKKILISGGGRCNFTNVHTTPENFISANPHFAKSALARYRPEAFIKLVEKHRIPFHEKKLGQLFCDRSANDVVSMLEEECRVSGVEIRLNMKINEVQKPGQFVVKAENSVFSSPRLVVATGGLSIAKIGATAFGYDLARQFGLKIQPTRAALAGFVFSEAGRKRWCDLAGVSTEVIASALAKVSATSPARKVSQSFREKMLFTHHGISGPAVLQISSYWDGKGSISLDLAPGVDLNALLRERGRRDQSGWKTLLREILPRRLADRWLEASPLTGNTSRAFAEAEKQLHSWIVQPAATEGYGKAEVTAGGVDTDELSARTMESHKVPGLFFIGEVVDVTGQLGGFNFQWAWASGFCAGQAL